MPIPLAALSTGASILSSLFGASSASKQLKQQRQQFEQQQALAKEQLALAKEAQRQGLATQVDAAGNVTAYDQASNTWKTILSADQQQLLDASETESLQQLTRDAPTQRADRLRGASDRIQEGDIASSLRSQVADRVAGRGGYSSDAATRSLRLAREQAVSQGFDDVSNALSTQAIRSGSGGLAEIGNTLAKARAQAIAQTMGNPDLEGRQISQQMNTNSANDTANLYNQFATRASAGQTGAMPVNTQPNNTSLAAARSAAQSGVSTASNINNSAGSMISSPVPSQGNVFGELFGGIANLAQSPAGADIYSSLFKPKATLPNKISAPVVQTRANRNAGFGF